MKSIVLLLTSLYALSAMACPPEPFWPGPIDGTYLCKGQDQEGSNFETTITSKVGFFEASVSYEEGNPAYTIMVDQEATRPLYMLNGVMTEHDDISMCVEGTFMHKENVYQRLGGPNGGSRKKILAKTHILSEDLENTNLINYIRIDRLKKPSHKVFFKCIKI